VVWGLATERNTFRYIHAAFYATLKKVGIPVVWVDDRETSQAAVEAGNLVIAVGFAARHLPLVDDAAYCLHNFDDAIPGQLSHAIRLQVYTRAAEQLGERWGAVVRFDLSTRTLYQPWGTDLLPHEFRPPIYRPRGTVFWVGSVWEDGSGQGNIDEIRQLKSALRRHNISFFQLSDLSHAAGIRAVRLSRIAPAIAGHWQAQNHYLPCRFFKNVSYGHIGFSNVSKFRDLLGSSCLPGETVDELVDNVLTLAPRQYLELVREQQSVIREHTYLQRLSAIGQALEQIGQ
jgi:hypothetical protein